MRELLIGKNDAGQRLDKFITKTLDLPMSLLYKSIRLKKIKVNRKRAENNTILNEGDTIQCFLAEEFFEKKVDEHSFESISVKLDIIYEDENIMLLNKRPGVSVHEDENGSTNTLITHIQAYLYQKGEYRPDEEQSFAPALCNRIDRNTGGIVIAAKNAASLRAMNEKIKQNEVSKFYLCAAHGKMPKKDETLRGYLRKDSEKNLVTVSDTPLKGGKNIETRYRVLREKNGNSLLEVELITGRTHQIRAHLAHVGHPLLGDGKYGKNRAEKGRGYKYQALYAYKLIFDRVGTDSVLSYLEGRTFSIPESDVWFLQDFA